MEHSMRCARIAAALALGLACLAWGSSGAVLYSRHGPEERWDCCTNNLFAKVLSCLQTSCEAAGPEDVVELPPMLDVGGRLRATTRLGIDVLDDEDIQHLKEIGRRHGCTIVTKEEAEAYDTERKLVSRGNMVFNGPFICWFYSRLKIPTRLQRPFRKCVHEAAEAFGAEDLLRRPELRDDPLKLLSSLKYVAVHARVELDWTGYCRRRPGQPQNKKEPRHLCFGPRDIAEAIRDNEHFPAEGRNYVLIHSSHLSKKMENGTGEHPAEVMRELIPGARVFDKQLSACTRQTMTFNFQALVDMFFGIYSQEWVGHHVSTFTNAVAKMRTCDRSDEALHHWKPGHRQDTAGKSAYVYSCKKEGSLVRRLDNGDVNTSRYGLSDAAFCKYTAHLIQPASLRHTKSGRPIPRKPGETL